MEKKPDFQTDAVAMVRRIRDAQHEQLAGKSWKEQVAYFHEQAGTPGAVAVPAEPVRGAPDREPVT